ncbi:hypothetical protein L3Q82_018710, partial [Scortum barcoo]
KQTSWDEPDKPACDSTRKRINKRECTISDTARQSQGQGREAERHLSTHYELAVADREQQQQRSGRRLAVMSASALFKFKVVDARSLVPVVAATPEPSGCHQAEGRSPIGPCWPVGLLTQLTNGYRQAKQAAAQDGPGGKNFGSGRSSCGWGAVDLDWGHCRTRWKKYFEDLLNPTDLPSSEEAEAGDSEGGLVHHPSRSH